MIRLAAKEDLAALEALYAAARARMKEAGNPAQWKDSYPPRALIEEDVARGRLYVCEEDALVGAFVFFVGEEPCYRVIDGMWRTEARVYGVIHRVASDGARRGFLKTVVGFCSKRADDLRIDTHRDNAPMRGALTALGFRACGVVIVDDGAERIAFERVTR